MDPADLVKIYRISYKDIPFTDPVKKPGRVKCRNVCPAADTKDHKHPIPFVGLTAAVGVTVPMA